MLPGYVVSTMVRALREFTDISSDEAKGALFELSPAELDSAVETYEALAALARECRDFHGMLRASSLGAE